MKAFIARPHVTKKMMLLLAYHLSYYVMDSLLFVMEKADEARTVSHYMDEENRRER